MRSSVAWFLALLVLCVMVGCDRQAVTSAPATAPAVASDPHAASTTAPADDAPARSSYMVIEQRRITFPPARLALRTRGTSVHALLYSDDPPEAIEETYTGNSYYLEMTFELLDGQEPSAHKWIYKAPTSERSDTVNGIYLRGRQRHLQPLGVVIEYERESPTHARVWLSGEFLLFDQQDDPTIPGRLVPVAAELDAELTIKSR